jgi:MoxR-like ATPase
MTLTTVADRTQQIVSTLKQVIVGKDAVLEQVLLGILANGHLLIEDYPGLAKTLIARLCAQVTALDFKRIQFTPDLLPSDITGSFLYNQREGSFEFRRGPVFTNLLLADEINRATPKTQAALLEVMQEQQVTIEGERFALEPPFSSSPPRTRSSSKVPTRCRKPNWTASSCACGWVIPRRRMSRRSCCAGGSADKTAWISPRWSRGRISCPCKTPWKTYS